MKKVIEKKEPTLLDVFDGLKKKWALRWFSIREFKSKEKLDKNNAYELISLLLHYGYIKTKKRGKGKSEDNVFWFVQTKKEQIELIKIQISAIDTIIVDHNSRRIRLNEFLESITDEK